MLGTDERELGAIFTVQTAGEALNYHPHLHGVLADGYWREGIFTRFAEIDLDALTQAFGERVLAQPHKRELLTDDLEMPSNLRNDVICCVHLVSDRYKIEPIRYEC